MGEKPPQSVFSLEDSIRKTQTEGVLGWRSGAGPDPDTCIVQPDLISVSWPQAGPSRGHDDVSGSPSSSERRSRERRKRACPRL